MEKKVGKLTADQISDFDTEVSNNSSVVDNTAKVSYPGSASAAELNILDGATITTTELNYVDGVTSAIQIQLDSKQASMGSDDNYVTDAEKVVIGNTSNTNTGDQIISDATITTTDITTNNVSTSKHGFAPKGDGSTTKYLNANGVYSIPAGSGGGDVVGPSSAINENLPVFDSTTGKLIKDSSINKSAIVANTAKVSYPGSADATELNILDGATLTTTELNYVDGVTSAIQTQLNGKQASMGSDDNYVTDAEKVVIGNTSNTNTGDQIISDATITTTDITTNNVSTSKHGFAPKGNGSATAYLNGTGAYSTPSGGGNVSTSGTPVDDDFAKFVNGTDIEGRSYSEVKTDLSLDNVSNVSTDDTAYNATSWNNNTDSATKNAIRDKIETMDTAIGLNTAKDTNVTTDLSEGTSTTTTVDVNSSDGTNATLLAASTSRAGLLTKTKFDEIVANTSKVSYTDASAVGLNTTHRTSDGTDHTYINQDLQTTATATFASLTLDSAVPLLNLIDGSIITRIDCNSGVGVVEMIADFDGSGTGGAWDFQIEDGNSRFLIEDTGVTVTGNIIVKGNTVVDSDGYLDNQYKNLTVGESVVAGNLLYFKTTDSKYWKFDASAEATASTRVVLAVATIAADATGKCLIKGEYTTSGLTVGTQYGSETTGAITATAPTTSGAIVRIIGNAESTTVLSFNPDNMFLELA